MAEQLITHVRNYEMNPVYHNRPQMTSIWPVQAATVTGEKWTAMLGDSCLRLTELRANSIDLSVYSRHLPIFTPTNSEFDLGNSRDYTSSLRHYAYIIGELLRVTKPGRSTCVHTADIPALATKDGYIGIKDFPR